MNTDFPIVGKVLVGLQNDLDQVLYKRERVFTAGGRRCFSHAKHKKAQNQSPIVFPLHLVAFAGGSDPDTVLSDCLTVLKRRRWRYCVFQILGKKDCMLFGIFGDRWMSERLPMTFLLKFQCME